MLWAELFQILLTIPHTPLLPLPEVERHRRHNFRATSKAGSPLCAAVLTSLWNTFDLSTYMEMDLTYGSDRGAFSTFAQLRDVMLLPQCNVCDVMLLPQCMGFIKSKEYPRAY